MASETKIPKVGEKYEILEDTPKPFASGLAGDVIEVIESSSIILKFKVPSSARKAITIQQASGTNIPKILQNLKKRHPSTKTTAERLGLS